MKFTLTIDLGNAAFDAGDNPRERNTTEIVRILATIADDINQDATVSRQSSGSARDYNGNVVAKWSVR